MFSGRGAIRRTWPLPLVVAAGVLMAACSGDPAPAEPTPSPARSSESATASAVPDSSASATTSQLTRDIKAAYDAATDAYPDVDLDKCARTTSLDDRRCGAALTAAENVAADTERRLRVKKPEYADVLYSDVFLTTSAVQDGIDRLRDPIPCYGLSDAAEPPPPLRAEAESICAEGADIFKSEWGIFLSSVNP
ncbi:hypothetical protein [Streptomyces sp. NPDC057301]|uniref:hypothetical protein n=1 Tax=Streptomyces sp. NPDC057301 TaxID=3346093 RepID=UPI003643812E